MTILQLLATDSFITYNKQIARKYGVDSAILLGAMCSYQASFEDNEFYKEQYKISEDIGLSEYEIKKALKVLKDNGLVDVKRKGVPSQNYYHINADKLGNILLTSELKINRLVSQKSPDYITNNTNTKNTINNKEEKDKENLLNPTEILMDSYKFSTEVKDSIKLWLAYKKEKRQTYTDIGLKGLLRNIQKDIDSYGEKYVVEEIDNSIAQNYNGIFAKNNNKKEEKVVRKSNWGSPDYYDNGEF